MAVTYISYHWIRTKCPTWCIICLKSADLHEGSFGVFVGFVRRLFTIHRPMKKCLNFDGVSEQEKIGQHFHMNCSRIGYSFELIIIVPVGLYISTPLLSHFANKNSSADLLK